MADAISNKWLLRALGSSERANDFKNAFLEKTALPAVNCWTFKMKDWIL